MVAEMAEAVPTIAEEPVEDPWMTPGIDPWAQALSGQKAAPAVSSGPGAGEQTFTIAPTLPPAVKSPAPIVGVVHPVEYTTAVDPLDPVYGLALRIAQVLIGMREAFERLLPGCVVFMLGFSLSLSLSPFRDFSRPAPTNR